MDFFQPAPNPNKERYDLMLKRRQSLLELSKLKKEILMHPQWNKNLTQDSNLEDALEAQLFTLKNTLCKSFCQAQSEQLEQDIKNIYSQLIVLSKVWLALEHHAFPVALIE